MLKHGRIGMTRPEQFPKLFRVYTVENGTNERGRVRAKSPDFSRAVRCILSTAKPDEQERFNQMGVKVTHTIIQRGAPVAKENDLFVLVKNGAETRRFRVQAFHNKGEMDIDTVYYCEERGDIA
ncbi:MAG: hypothetical protein RR893_07295 [Clostridia bacterium]